MLVLDCLNYPPTIAIGAPKQATLICKWCAVHVTHVVLSGSVKPVFPLLCLPAQTRPSCPLLL